MIQLCSNFFSAFLYHAVLSCHFILKEVEEVTSLQNPICPQRTFRIERGREKCQEAGKA